ncbi:MAG: recombination mediator RecR [Candidatus Omnitrophica bacterium]|nr:recombination mediator RecR [Candidatus Omnitrophota bacterium]
MSSYPRLLENVIDQLSKLPGVGRRSAERMAFWLLEREAAEVEHIAHDLVQLKQGLRCCRRCNHLSDQDLCTICQDPGRDQSVICVVEDPKDVIAIEKSGSYGGLYHVLLGTISPGDGRGPEHLKVQQLLDRVGSENLTEVVLATDPDSDGEMTALYLTKQLKPLGVKITRIGLGLPIGGSLEFADISTLSMSLTARRVIE